MDDSRDPEQNTHKSVRLTGHALRRKPCPNCGRENDVATQLDGSKQPPKPGDLTMCFGCGLVAVFLPDGIRAVSKAEFMELPLEIQIQLGKINDLRLSLRKRIETLGDQIDVKGW